MTRMLAAALALLTAVVASGPAVGSAPPATRTVAAPAPDPGVAVEGIRVEATSRYELVDRRLVRVRVEVELMNLVAPRAVGRFVESSVLDAFALPVLSEAQSVSVAQQGEPRPVDLATDAPRVSFVVVDLQPDLQYGTPQTVVLEYDLLPQPPRSPSFVRINPAFVTFPLFAIGDPGRADVVVDLPDGLDVTFVGAQPSGGDDGGRQIHRFDDIAEPEGFSTTVAARDDDALVAAEVAVSGVDVTVRAWPDDPEWADFVSRSLQLGIPALEDLIGRDWPAGDELDVVESASPYLYGYSGWFRPAEGLIEIGDELDDQVVLHELAHLWFNDRLFDGRWISEGFAEVYASRVRAELGREVSPPTEPAAEDPGAQPLEQWTNPTLTETVADDQERYGYATSHLVIDRLIAATGEGAMRRVLDAATEREISYVGDGPAEQVPGAPGWRRLLDLVEERTDATGMGDLFQRWVTAGPVDELGRRADARAAYAALVDAGAGWSAPHPVRMAMTTWEFDVADERMARSRDVLGRRAQLLGAVDDIGIEQLPGLERVYEQAATMGAIEGELRRHERAAPVVLRAADRVEGATGPLSWIGLVGDPARDHLDRAVGALEAGEVAAAVRSARRAIAVQDGATGRGMLRLLAASGILSASIGLWVVLRSSRDRRAALRSGPDA